jgi:hypothetical protein
MVEQVVGTGELHTPSASPVGCCSRTVAAVLEVDGAGQRRDVAAMGGEGLKKGVAGELTYVFSAAGGRARVGPREDKGARCPGQRNIWPKFG